MPPPLSPLSLVQRYAAGYFPMTDDEDPAHPVFFWDRCPIRAILPVNAQTAARARRMARRSAARFTIRHTTAVERVLRHLRHVRDHSWVQGPVPDIYRALHAAHLLHIVEAWILPAPKPIENRKSKSKKPSARPRLVGALLGIVLPGVFIAETMYGLVPEASKVCLCQLVQDCHAAGFDFIDVQTPHDTDSMEEPDDVSLHPDPTAESPAKRVGFRTPHPCLRLGEEHISHAAFVARLRASLVRHCLERSVGGVQDILRAWLGHAELHGSELLSPSCVQSGTDARA